MDKTAAGCGSPSPEGVIVQTDALPCWAHPWQPDGTHKTDTGFLRAGV